MSLEARLKAEIAAQGPLTVAQYMTRCLHDPVDGYYATRPALGEAGDFITAPLVSQMFGELLGLWVVATWRGLGAPDRVILAEGGPGDGTLMADVLRAARLDPAFIAAAEVMLIETSAPLRRVQAERLGTGPRWGASLDELPDDAPVILIANELLDCLPARQFVRAARGWGERVVGVENGALAFGLTGAPPHLPDARPGDVLEVSAAQEAFAADLGARIASQGGAALLIDYGRDAAPAFGDTLQALRRHQKVHPLDGPGTADLTVHADFPAVAAAASAGGAMTSTILAQGELLRRLGIGQRAAALSAAGPDQANVVGRQLERLCADDQMGTLFKALALYNGPVPPAFEAA